MILLQIDYRVCQWKKFENQLIFGQELYYGQELGVLFFWLTVTVYMIYYLGTANFYKLHPNSSVDFIDTKWQGNMYVLVWTPEKSSLQKYQLLLLRQS